MNDGIAAILFDLDADVAGARTAGLDAAWLADGSDPDPVPEYTLASLNDLLDRPWERIDSDTHST